MDFVQFKFISIFIPENYDAIIKDIVSDGRLYSINYHQKILKVITYMNTGELSNNRQWYLTG